MIFLIFLIYISNASHVSCDPLDLTKISLIPCLQHFDTNNNNELNVTEITIFLNSNNINFINVTTILNYCDVDHDEKLTMIDFNSNSSCLEDRLQKYVLCRYCNKNPI